MSKSTGWLAAVAMLAAAALPLSAGAQDKPPEKDKKPPAAAPAAKPAPAPAPPPAARPAPPPPAAARPAPPPAAARPAPPPAAARPAPPPPQRQAAPPPQRQAPPPQRQAAPPPQRQAAPPERRAAPQRQVAPPPAVQKRLEQPKEGAQQRPERQERRQERAQPRTPAPPAAAATPQAPAAAKQQAPAAATPQAPAAVGKTAQPQAAPQQAATPQAKRAEERKLRAQQRQEQRQERVTRQREDTELRRLPAAQRTQRSEEIKRTREQRAQQRQERIQQRQQQAKPATLAPAATAVQPGAARAARRDGKPRVTAQAARQGRFASSFTAARAASVGAASVGTARVGNARVRAVRDHPRRAWQRGLRAAFVPWFGPVFWPYAYSDIFEYTFWPGGYDDGYWAYAYDDFFDGVFWGEQGPPEEYVEVEPYAPAPAAPKPTYAAVQNLCKQPGSGITAWPIAEIEQKVGLNAEQKALLGDVRKAAADAAAGFKASCPVENAFPLTPPGRLQTMRARLNATLEAVQTVRPALEKFYESLSDEQKERFNQIGPKQQQASAEAREAQDTKSCKEPKSGLSNLPIEKIEDAVKPTEAQLAKLDALEQATTEGVSLLQAACPEETPLTPPGRLEAMEKRLQAMVDAADAVKPALEEFYGALTAEQKARFNRIGRELAAADTKQ